MPSHQIKSKIAHKLRRKQPLLYAGIEYCGCLVLLFRLILDINQFLFISISLFTYTLLVFRLFLKSKSNDYFLCLSFLLIGPLCNRPMGLQSGRLKNHMITASSVWDVNHAAHLARLHNRRRGRYMGAWSARYNTRYQWLQTDFGGAAKIIRISTQGRQDANQWVTQYYVTHSLDRVHFSEYKERNSRKVIRDFISVVFFNDQGLHSHNLAT